MGLEKSAAEAEVEAPAAEDAAPAAEGEDLAATLKDGEAAAEGEAAAADAAPAEEVAAPSAPATSSKPKGSTSSAHWGSTYKAQYDSHVSDLNEACKDYKRLRGPPFAVMHPPTCVSDERSQSFYQTEFG